MKSLLFYSLPVILISMNACTSKDSLLPQVEQTMLKATQHMVEEVGTEGGYVWYYLPDLSRRWGEMEAYPTMIWFQHPGTVSMGHLFLDAFQVTGNEYYYQAASKAASAVVEGQRPEGGWNYTYDFAGEQSLISWYEQIGKNGWRLEEFQHYSANSTFDDKVTADAARFLLRMYLERKDPIIHEALQKAIEFVLISQYSNGGWPQRYPIPSSDHDPAGKQYAAFFTFNDDVIWENIHFLVQCYQNLSKADYANAIRRGMDFYLLSQDGSGAWAEQYDLELNPAGARTYEPLALRPSTTFKNAMLLARFYELTGDRKFLDAIPSAISWLEQVKLPDSSTAGGKYSHATFVEIGTNRPIYVHRKGSNVKYGYYYHDYRDTLLLGHYGGKGFIDIDALRKTYDRMANLDLKKDSGNVFNDPSGHFELKSMQPAADFDSIEIQEIMQELDEKGRWLSIGAMISNPYIGEGQLQEPTDGYATTNVGDATDTSPFRDESDQEYISTAVYIKNMRLLLDYLRKHDGSLTEAEELLFLTSPVR
ncbi:MAG: pectate lyase [Saprospiraceae bacterium]|nr:pectate lyase [Saprospiraceae bacterium]